MSQRFQAFVNTTAPVAVADVATALAIVPVSRRLLWQSSYVAGAAPAAAQINLYANGVLDYSFPINPAWVQDGNEHSLLLPGLGPSAAAVSPTFTYQIEWVTTAGAGGSIWVGFDS
jgi:hypothetical protein